MNAAVVRVGLSTVGRAAISAAPPPLLDPAGPRVVLGAPPAADGLAEPLAPSAISLFGPRGACQLDDGALWISDTGHHRLLGWAHTPQNDHAPADWLIGQADFAREGRNGGGAPGPATVNVPTGVCGADGGLVVADAWNHRVLIWRRAPRASHVPADVVLGQSDFFSNEPNRGGAPNAATLHWPYGVAWDGTFLWVADSGNRRVLRWRGLPERNGAPADLVLGQPDFERRDENGGVGAGAATMRWPHAIAVGAGRLYVADAGNSRVMIWRRTPAANGAPADWLLGQDRVDGCDHNRGQYWPDAAALHMPYGIAANTRGVCVADTANSRLLAWPHQDASVLGAPATALSGQATFADKGDNGWQLPTRASLSWPYGIALSGELAVVADSGNNRVLLWPLAAGWAP